MTGEQSSFGTGASPHQNRTRERQGLTEEFCSAVGWAVGPSPPKKGNDGSSPNLETSPGKSNLEKRRDVLGAALGQSSFGLSVFSVKDLGA